MSIYKHGQLIITLKSDLCAGSGYSYAGVVDRDTCYDEYGIPYIPGRRIKGCMREAAESILQFDDNDIVRLFGSKGSKEGSGLRIDNAYIENYDQIKDYLAGHSVCTAQEILDRYTRVTGQTRLYDGVADPGSLRYTRSVNHYDPMEQDKNNPKELVFVAEFVCDDDEKTWKMIENVAKATRHIGLKRNRGLGNVWIEVKEAVDPQKPSDSDIHSEIDPYIECSDTKDGRVIISYAVRNVQPLMISRNMEDESADYIPGQQVIGLLAGRYLKDSEKKAEDDAFKDLFLNGKSIFSNLYPCDGYNIYYPAPDYLNRLKKSKKIVYNIGADLPAKNDISDAENFWYEEGNQPKKLKGKYVAWIDANTVAVFEVKKDIIYHHSHKNTHETENGKEEGILYSMEVIRRGQMFAGTITVPKEHVALIKSLLLDGELSFGKSRTAQYGKCQLVNLEEIKNRITKAEANNPVGENEAEHTESLFAAGRDVVVTFLSDVLINGKDGNPTVFCEDVRSAVAGELKIENISSDKYISSVQVTTATGYMGTWNLRRPAIPAIKAGSFLTFHLEKELSDAKNCIGERTLEGYGQIRIDYADGCRFDGIKEIDPTVIIDSDIDEDIGSKANKLIVPIIYDRWLERKINDAITGKNKVNVTNTAAGRFALMLRESVAEAGDGHEKEAFVEFTKRINSIKSESTKNEGKRLLKRIDDTAFLSMHDEAAESLEKDLTQLGKKISRDELMRRWPQYIMAILTDRKYKGR